MPARYPIHRVVRCAARGTMADLFDDLALRTGLAAQRLDSGALLLDGPGVFATLHGRPKARCTSCTFTFWTDTPERARRLEELLFAIIGERRMTEETFTMDWRFSGGHGYTTGASFEELADPALLDEAYPALGEPVAQFIERYLAARETILILQGPPGTGKTRLVRGILAGYSGGSRWEVPCSANERTNARSGTQVPRAGIITAARSPRLAAESHVHEGHTWTLAPSTDPAR